ncbi:MAG TPA: mitofilin family membrane protein, partial [Alphaproteobacteria bacterium]
RTGDDGSWWRPLLDRLTSLVTIRRIGEVDGDTPEAVVARAERRLAADDLAGAVAELERLQGAPAAAAGSWLADARARLTAEAALAGLTTHILRTGSGAP